MTIGSFGAIAVGSMVINDVVNNKLTPQGYPETQFLGISAFSYEYGLVFTTILGVFVFFGGLFMDSKKEKSVIRPQKFSNKNKNNIKKNKNNHSEITVSSLFDALTKPIIIENIITLDEQIIAKRIRKTALGRYSLQV